MSERTAVYRLYGADSVLVYVGVSSRPEARWVQHSATQEWWPSVQGIEWSWCDSREDALLAEKRAIAEHRPVFNVMPGNLTPRGGVTANRVIRVDDELWRDYGAACEAEGATKSDDLRAYMARKVKAWKRRQAAEGEQPG